MDMVVSTQYPMPYLAPSEKTDPEEMVKKAVNEISKPRFSEEHSYRSPEKYYIKTEFGEKVASARLLEFFDKLKE